MAIPPRIKKQSSGLGREKRDRCPSHLTFVRQHQCSVPGCDGMPIEVAHVRNGTDGGMGFKPGDQYTISLCSEHHREQHSIGEPSFEKKHGINMKQLATEFANDSPAWKRYISVKRMAE